MNSAAGGLYDNAAFGKIDGAYTSLYRALTDETSTDATEWQEQKEESAQKVKTDTTIGGIGAVSGGIGNLIINRE